jgi:transposase
LGTSKYSVEFRVDSVEPVRSSGRPIAQVARELGGNHETLRRWVRSTGRAEQTGAAAEAAKDAELARLRGKPVGGESGRGDAQRIAGGGGEGEQVAGHHVARAVPPGAAGRA